MNTKNPSTLPYFQLAIGAVMVSFSAVFVRLTNAEPTIDGFYQMLFGGSILLIVAVLRKEPLWANIKSLIYILLAGLMFALDLTFWHRSIDYIGPGLATIIVNLQVFVLSFVGIYIYGENWSWRLLAAIPLALLGMYFLVGYEWQNLTLEYKLGIGYCFIATVFYTTYILSLHKSQTVARTLTPIVNLALISLFAAAFLGIIAYAQHEVFFALRKIDFIWLLLYGFFGQVLGWLFISLGLSKTKISVAGFILLLQPALAFIWDILIFNRPTPYIEVVGSLITLIAIYLSASFKEG